MNKEIVFVNQTSGYLMVDIVNAFYKRGIKCSLIAGSLQVRGSKLSVGIKQHKIITYSKMNAFTRMVSWVIGCLQILWILKTRYRKSDVFFVSNPPVAVFLTYFLKNKMSFLLYDFFPDVLVYLKWQKAGSWIINLWESANRNAFQKAEAVFTISQNMLILVKERYELSNAYYVPLWADGDFFKEIPERSNQFVNKHGLAGKFLVVYSGTLRYRDNVDILVDVASLVKDEKIFFLLIGNGEMEDIIRKKINSLQLKNCLLLPFQPVEMLSFTIGCANLGVVPLGKGFDGLCIPSKTFTLLSAGKPILCIAAPETELSRLVMSNSIGGSFDADNLQGIASFIIDLESNKEKYIFYRNNSINTSTFFDKSNANKFADVLLENNSTEI